MECRHLNGIRADNRLENLAYGTVAENMADKQSHGTQLCGEQIKHFVKLTEERVKEIRQKHTEGRSMGSLGREYGVTVGNIHAIIHRKSWKHI